MTAPRHGDAAVTTVASHGPDSLGGRDSGVGARPGLDVRYGRVSLSSGAGFAARKQEVELRGLGIELAHSDAFDLTLSLRNDSGMLTPTLELTTGASLNIASDTDLRTYFGVTPEQSARSGYPVYTPGFGLRHRALCQPRG